MRAAIFRNGDIVVDTIADPRPIEGQVLVKTLCCGICGTDLHAAKHTQQFVERSRRTGGRFVLDPTRDVVFGHEFCCEVVEHGPNTDKRLKPGTLVCSMPLTVAQYMPLAERMLLPVPNGLPATQAALTEPIAVGLHAVRNARLTKDDVPLVIGCGPVGLSVIASLKLENVHPIIAADFSPARRTLAQRVGADIVVDPAETWPFQSWSDAATPRGYDASRYAQLFGTGPKQRPAVIFECVGVPGVIEQVIEGAPAGARIVVVGVCMETDRIEPFFGIIKQLSLQFVLAYTPQEFAESLHHIAEGHIDVTPLITGRVGLDGVKGAFADLANPGQHAKIIVEPSA
jgi:threonine dehydrogenase-like Zn-dependent dehydrogenase